MCCFYIALIVVSLQFLAQFMVQPKSVRQAEGLEAEFRCLYPGAQSHVWRIKGKLLVAGRLPPNVTLIPPPRDSPVKMIILATPQYHNAVVQCVALIIKQGTGPIPMESESAILEVQGILEV